MKFVSLAMMIICALLIGLGIIFNSMCVLAVGIFIGAISLVMYDDGEDL